MFKPCIPLVPREARTSAFARVMDRAEAEQLVTHPDADGIAWRRMNHTLTVTGRHCAG